MNLIESWNHSLESPARDIRLTTVVAAVDLVLQAEGAVGVGDVEAGARVEVLDEDTRDDLIRFKSF